MNQKLRKLFAFILISFVSLSAMEEGESRPSIKRKKEEITAEDTYPLWLYKKASQSSDPDTLSNESLAFLQEYIPEEIKQKIADNVYEDIDPYFISKLLCQRPAPQRLVTHSHPPYITHKENNEVTISCNHSPRCRVTRTFTHAGREYIQSNDHPLSKGNYHRWETIERSSEHHRIDHPCFMFKEANNNLISVHTDHSVYEWNSQPIEETKNACSSLPFEDVILLSHMQHSQESIENKAADTIRKALPRKLRSLQRAKKQKITAKPVQ